MASDIVLLDIRPTSLIADFFVICSAMSDRQTNAVVRDIQDTMRDEFDARPMRVEGTPASGWVLMDYGDVVVHVFSPAQRDCYQLEELWSTAKQLLRVQ
jgi:ribosome-associated protein